MRRLVVPTIVAAVLLPVLASTQPARRQAARPAPATGAAPADAWPQFRGSSRLTGVSASAPPATLRVLWTYAAGDVVDSSAAVANGLVFVGGGDGTLAALDLGTGAPRWKYATGNLIG